MEEENNAESEIVSIKDVLDQHKELEEEADFESKVDWGDENSCSHDEGYVRQPVFACLTCSGKSKEQFGFCYGCSMNCHVMHDVIELFDKRDFKCDCGTPKSGCSCSLRGGSVDTNNTDNKYSHNFDARYCWCNLKYDPYNDLMIQCIVCEDWFHHECINQRTKVPEMGSFKDLICDQCIPKCKFLLAYNEHLVHAKDEAAEPSITTSNGEAVKQEENPLVTETRDSKEMVESKTDAKAEESYTGELSSSEPAAECKFKSKAPVLDKVKWENTFWRKDWRKDLCDCAECLAMYSSHGVSFLLDENEDPANEDEGDDDDQEDAGNEESNPNENQPAPTPQAQKSKKRGIDLVEEGQAAFLKDHKIPHEKKIDLLHAYSDMSEQLKEYLRPFEESGKPVTKEDIESFFESLKGKRQKR